MQFERLKSAVVELLADAAAGRYVTVGYQRQGKAADEALDSSRMVQVYYSEGEFSLPGGRQSGIQQHDVTLRVELTVSKAAEVDVATLTDSGSSVADRQTALAALVEASALADESFDELARIVFNVLMDGRNLHLGLTATEVANRRLQGIRKDKPAPHGDLVVLTGAITLNARVTEEPLGDTGVACESVSVTIDIDGDDVERTGVETTT